MKVDERLLDEARLCYVDGHRAFFTTQDVRKQWGDDWDDAPYEHNADPPYLPLRSDDGHWEIVDVFWTGDFLVPCDGYLNSPFSVQSINRGDIAWLRPMQADVEPIHAGVTLREFIRLIQAGDGGAVYMAVTPEEGG